MEEKKSDFLVVWGDTVNFKQLLLGMVVGAVLSYASYAGGLSYLKHYHPSLNKGLLMGYALLFGVGGCVIVGIIAARIFKPKRIFCEEDFNLDKEKVLGELNLDLEKEAKYLLTTPRDVVAEMQELGLYHLFAGQKQREEGEK